MLNVKWHGKEECEQTRGGVLSMLDVKWRGKAEGEGSGKWH